AGAEQQGQAQGLTNSRLLLAERADDLQHAAHVPNSPVPTPGLRVRVVALDAGALHDPRLGVAHHALPIDLGKLMDCFLPLALAQAPQSLALEVIPRAAVGSPRKGVLTVLAHLHTRLTDLC